MKRQTVWLTCLQLLCVFAAFVSCQSESKITAKTMADGIVLSCSGSRNIKRSGGEYETEIKLIYNDKNTGEYECENSDSSSTPDKIYVKFRTCDNCIELDEGAIAGIVVGNVVATVVIGVAVYLVASKSLNTGSVTQKPSSERQRPLPNERIPRDRDNNEAYQRLKGGKRDEYDVLNKR